MAELHTLEDPKLAEERRGLLALEVFATNFGDRPLPHEIIPGMMISNPVKLRGLAACHRNDVTEI
jgi:hypothetical protein